MMNVLDALRYRLGGQDLGEPSLDPQFRAQQRPLPSGLPLVVQDAIRNQPSYQEGGQFMAAPWSNPNAGETDLPREDPGRRDYRLNDLLGFNRFMREQGGWAWPENQFPTPLEPGQSPFATPEGPSPGMDYLPGGATKISSTSPLNQFMPEPPPLTAEEQAGFMRRSPLAPGVGSATPPSAWFEDTPFNMTGGYSRGRNLRETSEPFNLQQFMYRRDFPF